MTPESQPMPSALGAPQSLSAAPASDAAMTSALASPLTPGLGAGLTPPSPRAEGDAAAKPAAVMRVPSPARAAEAEPTPAATGRTRRDLKAERAATAVMNPAIFLKAKQYLEDHALLLTKTMVERALKGDSTCLSWCMDKVWTRPEPTPPALDMPEFRSREDVTGFAATIMQAVAQGGLTLAQGTAYMELLAQYSQVLDMDELKQRLLQLEQTGRGGAGGVKRQKITLGAFEKPF